MEEKQMEEKQVYENPVPESQDSDSKFKFRKLVYYFLGILEILFAFRLVFKLLGAKVGSTFVSLIYTVSGTFMAPFSGIFRTAETEGEKIKSVFEPTILIAMVVYALIAYGIVRLIEIYKEPRNKGVQ